MYKNLSLCCIIYCEQLNFLFAGKLSPELKHVIQLMMEPDYLKRPSAEQILALPSVKYHIRTAKLKQVLQKQVQSTTVEHSLLYNDQGCLTFTVMFVLLCFQMQYILTPIFVLYSFFVQLLSYLWSPLTKQLSPSSPEPDDVLEHSGSSDVFHDDYTVASVLTNSSRSHGESLLVNHWI